MSRRKPKSNQAPDITNLAADQGSEDGGDPKDFHAKPWNAPKQANRKSHQLCAQVSEALHAAFGDCADDTLQALTLLSVEPAPHSGRLLVLVSPGEGTDRTQAEAALLRAAGFLRVRVAEAISRRHAPELVFEVF